MRIMISCLMCVMFMATLAIAQQQSGARARVRRRALLSLLFP